MTDTPFIQIKQIKRAFGHQQVLDGLSWDVRQGQVIGLLGRNGAGKSTLLECLLGLREVDAGEISLLGEDPTRLSESARARIGYVPQQSELFAWLTGRQLLDYFRALYPRWDNAKVDGLLSRWQIDANKRIDKLSGGEQQRLSIIRALAHSPDLLILDEPVSSLDPAGRRDFLRELIEQVVDHGTTVVFSTHILSDLERVAMDVAFLKQGRLTLQAPLDELLESARSIVGASATMAQLKLEGEISRQHEAGQTRVIARLDAGQLERLQHQDGLSVETINLEDLFVEVTQ